MKKQRRHPEEAAFWLLMRVACCQLNRHIILTKTEKFVII
jgi:hypothetical protein